MEELNPWLDPNAGKHKNKKSFRHDKKPDELIKLEIPKEVKEVKEIKENKLMPGELKCNDENILNFFNTLVEDSLKTNDISKHIQNWCTENVDEKWLEDFLTDINKIKDDLKNSKNFPDKNTLLLLKFLFLHRL